MGTPDEVKEKDLPSQLVYWDDDHTESGLLAED